MLLLTLSAIALALTVALVFVPIKSLPPKIQPVVVMAAGAGAALLEGMAEDLSTEALLIRVAAGAGISGQMAIGLYHSWKKRTKPPSKPSQSPVGLVSLVALALAGCTPTNLSQVCPVGASPIELARTTATVAQLVCAGKSCATQAEQFAAVVQRAATTREEVCNEWPTVEAIGATVNDPRLTASIATADRVLRCKE